MSDGAGERAFEFGHGADEAGEALGCEAAEDFGEGYFGVFADVGGVGGGGVVIGRGSVFEDGFFQSKFGVERAREQALHGAEACGFGWEDGKAPGGADLFLIIFTGADVAGVVVAPCGASAEAGFGAAVFVGVDCCALSLDAGFGCFDEGHFGSPL